MVQYSSKCSNSAAESWYDAELYVQCVPSSRAPSFQSRNTESPVCSLWAVIQFNGRGGAGMGYRKGLQLRNLRSKGLSWHLSLPPSPFPQFTILTSFAARLTSPIEVTSHGAPNSTFQ